MATATFVISPAIRAIATIRYTKQYVNVKNRLVFSGHASKNVAKHANGIVQIIRAATAGSFLCKTAATERRIVDHLFAPILWQHAMHYRPLVYGNNHECVGVSFPQYPQWSTTVKLVNSRFTVSL